MSKLKNLDKRAKDPDFQWQEANKNIQTVESMANRYDYEKGMVDLLLTGTGLSQNASRDYPLGANSGSYINWTLFSVDGEYCIWKYPVPTNYLHSDHNRLWHTHDSTELIYENEGEADTDSSTSFDTVALSGDGWVDNTTEAGTEMGTAFDLMDDADDFLYIADASKFNGADFELYQAGMGYEFYTEISSGEGWKGGNYITEDKTEAFTKSGKITFNATDDSDWTASGGEYYIRIKTTSTPTQVAQAFFIKPTDNIINLLSRSEEDLFNRDLAWCYYNSNIYVTIPNKGNPYYEGRKFIKSGSSSAKREDFFTYYNKFYLNYFRDESTLKVKHFHSGSIQAVIDSITDSAADNRYCVVIHPVSQNEQIDITGKSYISLIGTDRDSCVIWIGSGSHPHAAYSGGTVRIAHDHNYASITEHISLENLTIENRMTGEADDTYGGHSPECALNIGFEDGDGTGTTKYWDNITVKNCRLVGHEISTYIFGLNYNVTSEFPKSFLYNNIVESAHTPLFLSGFSRTLSQGNYYHHDSEILKSGSHTTKNVGINFRNSEHITAVGTGSYFHSINDIFDVRITYDVATKAASRSAGGVATQGATGQYHQEEFLFVNPSIKIHVENKEDSIDWSSLEVAGFNLEDGTYTKYEVYNPFIKVYCSGSDKAPDMVTGFHLDSAIDAQTNPLKVYNPTVIAENEYPAGNAYCINVDSGKEIEVYGNLATNADTNGTVVFKRGNSGGDSPTHGDGTLVGGTLTVNTKAVTANSIIIITPTSSPSGRLYEDKASRVAGTSFQVDSTDGTDTCDFSWTLED